MNLCLRTTGEKAKGKTEQLGRTGLHVASMLDSVMEHLGHGLCCLHSRILPAMALPLVGQSCATACSQILGGTSLSQEVWTVVGHTEIVERECSGVMAFEDLCVSTIGSCV